MYLFTLILRNVWGSFEGRECLPGPGFGEVRGPESLKINDVVLQKEIWNAYGRSFEFRS
jgi:hypothetical protein